MGNPLPSSGRGLVWPAPRTGSLVALLLSVGIVVGCDTAARPRGSVSGSAAIDPQTAPQAAQGPIVLVHSIRTDTGLDCIVRNDSKQSVVLRQVTLHDGKVHPASYCSSSVAPPLGTTLIRFLDVSPDENSRLIFEWSVGQAPFRSASHVLGTMIQGTGLVIGRLDRKTGHCLIGIDASRDPADDIPSVTIDQQPVIVESRSVVHVGEHVWRLIAGHWEAPDSVRNSDVLLISVGDPRGVTRAAVVPPAAPGFYFQPTQYEAPLRVTQVMPGQTADAASILLYNESTSQKDDIEIHEIRVDDRVIRGLKLPARLVADRQRYREDERQFEIPGAWSGKHDHVLTIEFSSVAQSTADEPRATPLRQSIAVPLRPGCRLPIGTRDSAALEGSLCVWHGGLRPAPDLPWLVDEIAAAKAAAPDLPVYFRMIDGQLDESLRAAANFCDLIEVAPGNDVRRRGIDTCEYHLAHLDAARRLGRPFVSSVRCEQGFPATSDELVWKMMAALTRGACGLRVARAELDRPDSTLGQAIAALPRFLDQAIAIPTTPQTETPGISARAVALSPRLIAVFVLNEWGAWSTRSDSGPATVYDRYHVGVDLGFRPKWDDLRLSSANADLGPLEAEHGLRLRLPRLGLAEIVLLHDGELPRELQAAFSHRPVEQPAAPPALQLLRSPFIALGQVNTSSSTSVAIPVRNLSADPIVVDLKELDEGVSNRASTTCLPVTIAANSEARIVVNLRMPKLPTKSLTRLQLDVGNGAPAVAVVVDAECVDEVVSNPAAIDFGNYVQPKPISIRLTTRGDRLSIRSVEMSGASLKAQVHADELAVDLIPPDTAGPFAGTAVVVLEGTDGTLRRHDIPVRGVCLPTLQVSPSAVVIAGGMSTPVTRKLRVTAAPDSSLQVTATTSSDAISITSIVGVTKQESEIVLSISPDRIGSEQLLLHCDVDGAIAEVAVPVRVVGRPQQAHVVGDLKSIETLAADVQRVSKRFQNLQLPPDTPNWIVIHQLIMFSGGDPANRQFQEVVRRALVENPYPVGAFLFSRGRPLGRTTGSLFDRQHHPDQFLEYFAACGLPGGTSVRCEDQFVTIDELMKASQFQFSINQQLPWTAAAYAAYCREPSWKNKFAEVCSYEELCRQLLAKADKTCGGSHWYFAIAEVRNREGPSHSAAMKRIRAQADQMLHDEINKLKATRRKDGALRLPLDMQSDVRISNDIIPNVVNIHYSGHSLEWISRVLTPEELREPWIMDLVRYLVGAIESDFGTDDAILPFTTEDRGMTFGFLSHAIGGLQKWRLAVDPNAKERRRGQ